MSNKRESLHQRVSSIVSEHENKLARKREEQEKVINVRPFLLRDFHRHK